MHLAEVEHEEQAESHRVAVHLERGVAHPLHEPERRAAGRPRVVHQHIRHERRRGRVDEVRLDAAVQLEPLSDLRCRLHRLRKPCHGDEVVRRHEAATQSPRAVVVVPLPPQPFGEIDRQFLPFLLRGEYVECALGVRHIVLRTSRSHQDEVGRLRAVGPQGPLEDEVVAIRQHGVVRLEARIHDRFQEAGRRGKIRERVREGFGALRFGHDPDRGFRDDSEGAFRTEEERGEVCELATGVRVGCRGQEFSIGQDHLEVRDHVPQASASKSAETRAPGVDRASNRAPDRVRRSEWECEPLRFDEVLEVFPGHTRLGRHGPAVRVEREDPVHLPHVDEHAPAVRDGAAVPAGAAAARGDLQEALVTQLDEGRDLLRGLGEGDEVGVELPLEQGHLREGREVVAVHHPVELGSCNALGPQRVHEAPIRIIEARHRASPGDGRG